ncbi:hypothetical protein P1X15_28850 [Runella sp. MFBS21]|uniref:hypothetical protein n=1 Tax=Runella sp. MFBS21 TaxID=3034018 RepID=UPI0023FA44B7|nr:hypothetical protein [Runella sp. MFBS21]MDF7821663.1 hypothetical protein [Runella sp. MFBS21]
MSKNLKPYSTIIGETHVTVVVFGDELNDLMGCEMDAGDPFWHIVGTDAWFEKQEVNGENLLVAKTYDKEYFSVTVDNKILNLLEKENGVLVLFPNFPLKADDIKQTTDLEKLREWMNIEIGEDNIEGVIYCFYTEEDKKKYHE